MSPSLDELNDTLAGRSMRAGWNKKEPSLWAAPRTSFVPAHWRWREAKTALDDAGRLISTELADRRNLFMVNPHPGNHYPTVRTLVAAYQMILPGETARSHRHTPNALRLVLEGGEGAYTIVDGTRIDMRAGDVMLTPGFCWHGHGNDGTAPAYWIDVLDVPAVQLLEPMFLEHWPGGLQTATARTRDHAFVYAQHDMDQALDGRPLDPRHGAHIELNRDGSMPTIAMHLHRMPAGFRSRRYRTTANQIVCVRSGAGVAQVADRELSWEAGDVFVVPTWHDCALEIRDESVLFRVTDEKLQRALGFLRDEDV